METVFSRMGSGIAVMEQTAIVPGTPENMGELCAELRYVCAKLNIPNVFYGLSAGMNLTQDIKSKKGIYILTLDSEKRRTTAIGFPTVKRADEHYLEMEKENKSKPHIQTVMVKLDSIKELRRAYPGLLFGYKAFHSPGREFLPHGPKSETITEVRPSAVRFFTREIGDRRGVF